MNINYYRVWGIIVRHMYNFRRNWDRITDAFYWPSIDLIIWGLTLSALLDREQTLATQVIGIMTSIVFWYFVWRGQAEISVNLLEEIWSENLVNIFSTPLTLTEMLLGFIGLGFIKFILTLALTTALAYVLYAVNVFSVGMMFVPFAASLIFMSWAFGMLLSGLFFRFGSKIQTMAWAGAFILMPFSAVYYPLKSMPIIIQKLSVVVPSTYIFEGIRAVINTGSLPFEFLVKSYLLNAVYLFFTGWFFVRSFQVAKDQGLAHLK